MPGSDVSDLTAPGDPPVDRPPELPIGSLRRLHPLTPVVRLWSSLAIVSVYVAQDSASHGSGTFHDTNGWLTLGFAILVIGGGTIYSTIAWWVTTFGVIDGDIRIESGFLVRKSRRVRLDRLQAVELRRPLLGRVLGLTELRLEVVGAHRAEGSLAYLGEHEAVRLRAELLARAAGVHADEPESAPEAPETVLHTVPFGRLLAATLLRLPIVLGLTAAAALLVVTAVTREPSWLIVFAPALFGIGQLLTKALLAEGGFTVARSPDGLRLRRGLTETRAQTVPPGRIQAVRLSEPLLWRVTGWARLDVTVAGYGKERQRAASSALLPVAARAEALELLRSVIAGAVGDESYAGPQTVELTRAPKRARWADPFAWRVLAAGADDFVFVSRRGIFVRRLDVMPHAKAQSLRLTQGPLQRRLRVASVHLDLTPGPISVVAEHRDVLEARAMLDREVVLTRLARARDHGDAWMTESVARGPAGADDR